MMEQLLHNLISTWWGITIICILSLAVWVLISALLYKQFFKRFYDIVLSGIALLVLSPIIIILIVAKAMDKFKDNKFVNYGFYGIRPAVAALIALAFVDVAKTTLFDFDLLGKGNFLNIGAIVLFAALLFLTNKFKKIHPIVFIAVSAVVGIIFKF